MVKTVKTVWNIISSLIVAAAVILAVLLAGVRIFGLTPITVLSGSMEPQYHTGSLIYIKDADTKSLEQGDVITFRLDNTTLATHRIVRISEDGSGQLLFTTKGDANKAEDGRPVMEKDVVGKAVFTVPGLGYLASFLGTPHGKTAAAAGGIFLLMLIIIPELLLKDRKKSSD